VSEYDDARVGDPRRSVAAGRLRVRRGKLLSREREKEREREREREGGEREKRETRNRFRA